MRENGCCRQHKAKAESAKLNLIKQELDRLDQLINTDVSVIRDKIEVASREFLEAQCVFLIIIVILLVYAYHCSAMAGRVLQTFILFFCSVCEQDNS